MNDVTPTKRNARILLAMQVIARLKNFSHKILLLFKETFSEFIDDNALQLSAALSFYTIFSLPPLLIIIISITGFFFGTDAVTGRLFWQINGLVGNAAALQIQEVVTNIRLLGSSTFAATVGVIVLFIGASSVFSEIQDSVNFIWGIVAKPQRGIFKFLKNRLMSFSMIGSLGFLLLVGLIINSLTDLLNTQLAANFPKDAFYLFYAVNLLLMFVITTLLFTLIFKTLPDGKVALKDCLVGASFTAFLFMIGKFAIGAYLGSSVVATAYGAAGSVVIILLWVYYSAIILYFGVEFTKVYAHSHGQKIIPNEYSVRVKKQEVKIEAVGVKVS